MAPFQIAHVTRAQRISLLCGIYAIVNDRPRDPIALAAAALDAGVRVVQYRAKRGIVADRVVALRALTRERGALLLLNDDIAAACALECDGVHLGPDDGGFERTARLRERLRERLLGLSCGTVQEAQAATACGADYVGIGCVYATATKRDAGPPIGIHGLRTVAAATPLPAAAIGGIGLQHIAAVAGSGVAMAAVISAIADADDPHLAAGALVRAWDAATAR